jgi:hypothetical protein
MSEWYLYGPADAVGQAKPPLTSKEPTMSTATVQQPSTPTSAQQESPMSVHAVAARFVELCNQGKNFDIMRTLYSPDIVSVEDSGEQTVGQTPVIEKSERWVAVNTIDSQTIRGPFFNGANESGGQFAIHFVHEVTPKTTGKRIALEEVAIYTVKNGQITREQFFNAGGR